MMMDESAAFESGTSIDLRGEMARWSRMSTAIPTTRGDHPVSVTVVTAWNEGRGPVTTQVIAGRVGHLVIAHDVDGSQRAALEAEHRRVVALLRTREPAIAGWP